MSLNVTVNLTITWDGLDADGFQQLLENVQQLGAELEHAGATVTASFDRIDTDAPTTARPNGSGHDADR